MKIQRRFECMCVCTFENWWWWRRDGKWDDDNAVRIPNTAWIFCNFHCVCIEWMNEYMQKHFPRTFFLFHSLAPEWRDDVDEFNVHGCAGEYLPSSSDIFIILRAFRPFCCSNKAIRRKPKEFSTETEKYLLLKHRNTCGDITKAEAQQHTCNLAMKMYGFPSSEFVKDVCDGEDETIFYRSELSRLKL